MGNPGYEKDVRKKSKPLRDGVKMYLEEVDDRKCFLAGGPSTSQTIKEDIRRLIKTFDRTWDTGENQNKGERLEMVLPSGSKVTLMTHTERFSNQIGLLFLST